LVSLANLIRGWKSGLKNYKLDSFMSEEKNPPAEVESTAADQVQEDLSPERIGLEELQAQVKNDGPHDDFDWDWYQLFKMAMLF